MNYRLILIGAFALTACEESGLPSKDQASQPGGGPVPPIDGGVIAPPRGPAHSIATTTGGYVMLTKIDSYEVSGAPDFVGATESPLGLVVVFERYLNYSARMWDIYKVVSGVAPEILCTIPRPGASNDRYSRLFYDGTAYRIYGESGSSTWSRLFDFDLSSCALGSYRTLYTSTNNNFTVPLLNISNGQVFHSWGTGLRVFSESTGLFTNWTYSTATIADASPSPLRSSFAIDALGKTWFVDTSRRLWRGNTSGTWDGFAEFPSSSYGDLYYARQTLPGNGNLKVITYRQTTGTFMVYHMDTNRF